RSSRRRARAKPRSQSNEAATGPPSVAGSIVSSASSTDSNAEVDNLSILFRPDASGYGDGSGGNAEGEIRTPEGLAAHQISSLARWTALRRRSDPSHVLRADDDVGGLEDPLWQLSMFVQTKDVQEGRKQRGPERRELFPQRVEHFDPGRGLDRLLRRGDRQGHHLLVPVADEERADRLPELVRGESLPDRHAFGQAAWVAVVAPRDRDVLRQVH